MAMTITVIISLLPVTATRKVIIRIDENSYEAGRHASPDTASFMDRLIDR